MPHRIEKIESTLQRTISEVIQKRISDPRITEGLVSITRVKVSPDLHQAIVYTSVMPEGKQKQAIAGLHHAAGRIRSFVGKAVQMKTLPRLEFRLDASLKTQSSVYEAIQRGMTRTPPEPPEPPEAEQSETEGPRSTPDDAPGPTQ